MSASSDPNCIFCKIAAGQIPARKVFEDEHLIAFHDINPWAPVHVLIVPRQHIVSLAEVGEEHAELMGRMMVLAPRLMRELGVSNGFRTLINTGKDGLQEVMHLHMHVIGGPRPWAKG
ncbi:histidine triad nucleotide-binding protein [Rivibacter subsaxonicus]|jgi:histidine triad (HIT) family protein|uniref:Histidine triad (HIT) family protein n=1 Tax=Rivibacter subsaxonicus TaxID=457575 RepID=A0A4Q7VGJ8_9BURK|nr:histidine triad nucleotide-binding protein [Rivibacter subsaxonicus]RZT95161.1 histidine triad (HIT) family protein [Rivibacter subsaxonicus]